MTLFFTECVMHLGESRHLYFAKEIIINPFREILTHEFQFRNQLSYPLGIDFKVIRNEMHLFVL